MQLLQEAVIKAITPYLEALQEANRVLINHNKDLKRALGDIKTIAAEVAEVDHEDIELLDQNLSDETVYP